MGFIANEVESDTLLLLLCRTIMGHAFRLRIPIQIRTTSTIL